MLRFLAASLATWSMWDAPASQHNWFARAAEMLLWALLERAAKFARAVAARKPAELMRAAPFTFPRESRLRWVRFNQVRQPRRELENCSREKRVGAFRRRRQVGRRDE
jgi:hypothetical protein